MTLMPTAAPKTFAHRIVSLQSRAWLPPVLLLLALSSVFIFGDERRGYFYRAGPHGHLSAEHLTAANNLSSEHRFLMFMRQTLDADGKTIYQPYYRFPIGGFALIKLAILPFGDDLSAKIYAARTLMLLFFVAAAVVAYLSLRRLTSSRWIALTATLLAFSSAYCLYYGDIIQTESMIDLFAVMLVFHGMAVFEQEGRFRQLLAKTCIALLLGWHVYALLLPFIAFGLMRELVKARSGISPSSRALCQLRHTALSLLRSRYLTLGVVALLFGISVLTFNFINEYLALNRETPLTELPSFKSMVDRIGLSSNLHNTRESVLRWLNWRDYPERQFHRVGLMSLPYAFSPSFVEHDLREALLRSSVILGIAVSLASLIGLLFIRRHKILWAALALSGFCWNIAMRYNTAFPYHQFEALYYIGVALTLFSLILLCLSRLSSERLIAALSIAALLIFVFSALRMSQLDNPNQTVELHKAAIADFEVIRRMADGKAIVTHAMPKFHESISVFNYYYLSGSVIINGYEIVSYERPPDFVVTGMRAARLASLAPQNQVVFLYEWDDYHKYISETTGAVDPLIRSDYDVYLDGNTLVYVKDACHWRDIKLDFFLAIFPADESDLPEGSSPGGFENLDFHFYDNGIWLNYDRCACRVQLPDYDIARIYTGQYIQQADGSFEHPWEGEIHLTEAAP